MENLPNYPHQDIAKQIKREGDFIGLTLQDAAGELMARRRHIPKQRQFENGFTVTTEEVVGDVAWQYSFQFIATDVESDESDESDELVRMNQYILTRESTEELNVSRLSVIERQAFLQALMRDMDPDDMDEDDWEFVDQIKAGVAIPCRKVVRTSFCCDEAGMALELRDDTATYDIGNGAISTTRMLVDIVNQYNSEPFVGYDYLRESGALLDDDTLGEVRYCASDADMVIMRDVLYNLGLGGGEPDPALAVDHTDGEVLQLFEQSLEVDLGQWRDELLDCTQPYIDQLNALDPQDPQYTQAAHSLFQETYAAIHAYGQGNADGPVADDMLTIVGKQLFIERDVTGGLKSPVMRSGMIDGVFAGFDIASRPSEACLDVDMTVMTEEELASMVDNFGLHIVLEEAYVTAGQDQQALPVVSDLLYVPLQRSHSQIRRYVVE